MSTIDDKAAALLERPSLEGLAYALRHREVWPAQFDWYYGFCETCAMGIAVKLWDQIVSADYATVGPALNMHRSDARRIFLNLAIILHTDDITPEHVADAIDALLASRAP